MSQTNKNIIISQSNSSSEVNVKEKNFPSVVTRSISKRNSPHSPQRVHSPITPTPHAHSSLTQPLYDFNATAVYSLIPQMSKKQKLSEEYKQLLHIIDDMLQTFMNTMNETIAQNIQNNPEVIELKNRVDTLERKLEENNVVMQEKIELQNDNHLLHSTKNISYITGELPHVSENEDIEEITVNLLKTKLKINLQKQDFREIKRITSNHDNENNSNRHRAKDSIKIRVVDFSTKLNILKACKLQKPSIYVNDYIPLKFRTLLKNAIEIKKKHPYLITYCIYKKNAIHVKNNTREAVITTKEELDKFVTTDHRN